MLKYLTHSEIDFQKWDQCIDSAPNAIVYGYSWYLDVICPNWHGIVKEAPGGEYAAVMPLPVFKKFGIKYIRQPLFAQQLGVFYKTPLTELEWKEISEIIRSKFWLISRYEFNTGNTEILAKGLPGFECKVFNTYHVSLNSDYDNIFSAYRKDRKWRVNQASKQNNLSVRPSNNLDLQIKIFHETVAPKIYGIIGYEYEYRLLKELYKAASARNLTTMYEVVDEDEEILGVVLLLCHNKKLIYFFNSSTPKGKQAGAMSFIVDYMLKHYSNQELVFDFESPEINRVASFYRSFGSEKTPFLSISLNRLPAPVKFLKEIRFRTYRFFVPVSKDQ
ncbi:GNAT family N-acetyltransferase [Pontibacter sp. H249]|uniref:GNAT family N-acetyltransferase n=1 Tax=Pontibacter sp. H249 TaxID=3133420 RepID=UPI0030C4E395